MATWREARRGKYSVGFKKRVVAEALVPGASVANIARAHGLNGNMIFGWRKDPRFQPTEKKRKAMEAALADAGSKGPNRRLMSRRSFPLRSLCIQRRPLRPDQYLVACDFRISLWNRADNSIFQV